MKLSIVVPCYNEAENIPLILQRFSEIVDSREIEVILVNNGSYDNSEEVFKAELPMYPFAKKVNVEVNQGYGYGILQGLKSAEGVYVGWTHADMQTDPKDIAVAYDFLQENDFAEKFFVKGRRKGRSLFDTFFTNGMSVFETLYLGAKLFDINAQPNIFSRSFFDSWKTPPNDFALDLYACFLAAKQGLTVKRFDVQFPKRIYGQSHWNTGIGAKFKFIRRTIAFSRNLKRRGIS